MVKEKNKKYLIIISIIVLVSTAVIGLIVWNTLDTDREDDSTNEVETQQGEESQVLEIDNLQPNLEDSSGNPGDEEIERPERIIPPDLQ